MCKRQIYASAWLEKDHNQDEFNHNFWNQKLEAHVYTVEKNPLMIS